MQRLIDADAVKEELKKSCKWHAENSRELSLLQRDINIVEEQPTIDAVPLSVVHKAAKKLAYIHQQIDLYGDRPDLHEEEYWLEYLTDEEWEDDEID